MLGFWESEEGRTSPEENHGLEFELESAGKSENADGAWGVILGKAAWERKRGFLREELWAGLGWR